VEDVIAVTGFFTTVIVAFLAFGPIGRAIAASITRKSVAANPAAEVLDAVEDLSARVDALQREVGELADRQDFTERLLARAREQGALGSGGNP
jgi:hypothetical protein